MNNKKLPEVSAKIIKSQITAKTPIIKAESKQISDNTTSGYSDWLTPNFDMQGLKKLEENSTTLPQCVRAYKNNIAGFGIGVRYKDDYADETQEMIDEFNKAERIIELLNFDKNTKEVFEDIIEAREIFGISYAEVIRNGIGDVVGIEFISDTQSIRKTRKLAPYVSCTFYYKGDELERDKKFCKYKQEIGSKTVYFKEFGDPRKMNKHTGDYIKEESTIELNDEASEIIEFVVGVGSYGEVRWTGQILGIDGSRKAETLNNNYFMNGRHTPLLIMIEGGTVSEESYKKLQEYMNDIKGENGQHAFMLLEFENNGTFTAADDSVQQPKIKVENLASVLQKDELFQDYLDNNRRKVQSAFQLPDLYVGYTTDFNRATAQTAMEVTEKQVFQPERIKLAWVINNKLLSSYKFKYVEAYFKAPDISNPDDLYKMLTVVERAGGLTPNRAKEIGCSILGKTSEDYVEDWGNIPLVYLNTQPPQTSITEQLEKQISKAVKVDDEAVVAVMKEVRDLLLKSQDNGKTTGVALHET